MSSVRTVLSLHGTKKMIEVIWPYLQRYVTRTVSMKSARRNMLTACSLLCYNVHNNIRKALTERVVCDESSRENDIWWKSFMRIAGENHS